jgi:hypothetical protein
MLKLASIVTVTGAGGPNHIDMQECDAGYINRRLVLTIAKPAWPMTFLISAFSIWHGTSLHVRSNAPNAYH